jgi:hypothetical protein
MSKTRRRSNSTSRPESEVLRISINKLRFDPTNPRIAELAGESPTQAQIRDLLLGPDMQARDLVPSFMENGYLPYEPLIVRPESHGKCVILEGNRRLAALLSMQDSNDPEEQKAFVKHRLDQIPCLVFVGGQSQELAYLGLRHLSKTKDWTASAKAAFVERVLQSGRTLKEAARMINTTPNNLRTLLLTRRLFERAGELGLELPSSSAEGAIAFWHLGDAVRRTNTKQYLDIEENEDPLKPPTLNESNFERLAGWLYGNVKTKTPRVIQSIRDIPELDKCLSHPRAIKVLENGGTIAEASEELQAAGANVGAHLERAKKSVQRATGLLSDVYPKGKKQLKGPFEDLTNAVKAFGDGLRDSEK